MVIIPTSAPLHPNRTINLQAVSSSALLHGLLALWLLYSALPSETMPQQIIQVSLIAASSAELAKLDFTPEKPAEPEPQIKETPKQEEFPTAIKDATHTSHKKESIPRPRKEIPLAALKPTAGASQSPKQTEQAITTAPVFDANYLRNTAPDYPAQAKRRGMQGSVMLNVTVTEDGTAKMISIASSSGYSILDDSARNAVSRWKFIPAKRNGETVEARVIVPIDFRLE